MSSAPEAHFLVAGVGSTPVAWRDVCEAANGDHAMVEALGF
jgi:hypothetical protein